ncbi:hypothetical protein OEZ85_002898 [Tetradesmus obliquus]|uniref:Secreted protein n=1 Tax=Tetradesmus obliquus TaxID=3088 RepID=A0ABY8TZ09_TETOB|nr:hypothetical protein OEZ85_002898 [Tetradesmus obliquus]
MGNRRTSCRRKSSLQAAAAAAYLCLRGIATPRLGRAMVGRHTVRVILHYNNQQVQGTVPCWQGTHAASLEWQHDAAGAHPGAQLGN